MIMILLGILDILAGLSVFSLLFFSCGPAFVWFVVLYLIAKALLFIKNIASIIDIIVAIIFIAAILGHTGIITYLGSVWLIQKGVSSFF